MPAKAVVKQVWACDVCGDTNTGSDCCNMGQETKEKARSSPSGCCMYNTARHDAPDIRLFVCYPCKKRLSCVNCEESILSDHTVAVCKDGDACGELVCTACHERNHHPNEDTCNR